MYCSGVALVGFAVEKIQAMFTVLGAFGAVSTEQNSSSTRFSMIFSLDFSAAGRITAAHLQVPQRHCYLLSSGSLGPTPSRALQGDPSPSPAPCSISPSVGAAICSPHAHTVTWGPGAATDAPLCSLQTMLLERGRVAQQPPGESNFNIFPMMLAGLDAAQR